ncbi:MAG: amidohydrolase family protein [Bacteroidia bacterium]|nr:amidohydrolase family protein [Bacteroidia bacterium]
MNKLLIGGLIWFWLLCVGSFAQSVPKPAPAQARSVSLVNGTIHTGNGLVIERGTIVFANGQITKIQEGESPETGSEIIDCSGKHIYPGLIATNTKIGLVEIDAARPTRDINEVGRINSNIRAIIAYNTDSRVTPTIRSNGILYAQIVPDGELISGLSSVVQLDAWSYEEASFMVDVGLHIRLPAFNLYQSAQISPEDQRKKQLEVIQELRQIFTTALRYRQQRISNETPIDLRWEAMRPILAGEKPVFFHVQDAQAITQALSLSSEFKLKPVIIGGGEIRRVIPMIKSSKAAVILRPVHSLPFREDDPVTLPYELPNLLQEAGIMYALSLEGMWNQRNLPFQAGTAAAYGLPKEQALQSITLNAAKILGCSQKIGSLETGKEASLIVTSGDVLDMQESIVELAFISGRKISLANKQTDLYEKFKSR